MAKIFTCIYTTTLELILAEISEMNERSAPPPVAEYGGLPSRKTFFTIFDFARDHFFF